ncbi:MAG TPA: hypothetical protein VHR72_08185 [Gemmataceae bacterium]|jgi:hypothetical protein|nr:hypothetical protein [Gemmataceae bacterium]
MRHLLVLVPLVALVGCASEPAYQYPAQYAYPQPTACQPVSPCAPGYRPYQYSNYVPQPVQQANFQGPPAPPPTQEPPR